MTINVRFGKKVAKTKKRKRLQKKKVASVRKMATKNCKKKVAPSEKVA